MANPLRKPLAAYRLRRAIHKAEREADRLEASCPDAAESVREKSYDLWGDIYILRDPAESWPEQKMYLSFYGLGYCLNRRA